MSPPAAAPEEFPRYRGWFGRYSKKRCPHRRLVGIYGDRINRVPYNSRLRCLHCGRYLDGPAELADERV